MGGYYMVKNFETIKELYNNNCVNVPNKPGIYIVKLLDDFKVNILIQLLELMNTRVNHFFWRKIN